MTTKTTSLETDPSAFGGELSVHTIESISALSIESHRRRERNEEALHSRTLESGDWRSIHLKIHPSVSHRVWFRVPGKSQAYLSLFTIL